MPILARDGSRRRLLSRGGERRLIPRWSAAVAGLRRKRERVKAGPVRSGCGELELAQGVEGAFADLARDSVAPPSCRAVGGWRGRARGRGRLRGARARRLRRAPSADAVSRLWRGGRGGASQPTRR